MFKTITVIVLMWIAVPTIAQTEFDDPYLFVKTVGTSAFSQIKKDQQLINSDATYTRVIVEQQLMPHIDHVYAALSVLGTAAKDVPRDKLDEYFGHFKRYLITTYANALSQYTNQVVEFEPSRPLDGRKTVSVKANIKEPGKPDIQIIFQVRRNREGQWKAYDLVAEGISMVQSKRSEFAPILRQKGIDAVIAFMREQSNKSTASI